MGERVLIIFTCLEHHMIFVELSFFFIWNFFFLLFGSWLYFFLFWSIKVSIEVFIVGVGLLLLHFLLLLWCSFLLLCLFDY